MDNKNINYSGNGSIDSNILRNSRISNNYPKINDFYVEKYLRILDSKQ